MRILFVHQNFPGQFGRLTEAAIARGDRVAILHCRTDLSFSGAEIVQCDAPVPASHEIHSLVRPFDEQVRRGETTALRASELKRAGFTPDVIVGHPGWGELLFLKDVWPQGAMVAYPEYHYAHRRSEMHFDPEFARRDDHEARSLRIRSTANLHAFDAADRLWSPTEWQRSSLPFVQQSRTVVIHDGIDTDAARPNAEASVTITRDGVAHPFRGGDEVITFVNRSHEPVRGFHIFMRALPGILARRPKAKVILIGGDGVSYGARPPSGGTWREFMLKELDGRLDLSRVFFVGKVPKEIFLAVLQISSLHVYLTYPFVLSWSLLEAMSCGCRILASRTGPVTEFVEDGVNGTLFDFFRPDELADKAVDILHHRGRYEPLRHAARRMIVERCDLKSVCLPAQLRMIDELAAQK